MRRYYLVAPIGLCSLLWLVRCADRQSERQGAAGQAAAGGTDASGMGGTDSSNGDDDACPAIPTGSPLGNDEFCSTLTAPGEPTTRIAWAGHYEQHLSLSGGPTIELTPQFAVRLPDGADPSDYVAGITYGELSPKGGVSARFKNLDLPAMLSSSMPCAVGSAPSDSLPTSGYPEGITRYTFTLWIRPVDSGCEVSSDEYTIYVDYGPPN